MKYKSYIKYFLIFSFILISLLPAYNFYQYAKNYDFKKSFNLDNVEKYVNYTIYKLFNRSMNQSQVIAGKDDFLFLGNNYDNVLHKTNGIYKPTNQEINNWTNKLKDLQKWYEERGIKFVIVIAPNKHSIYKENLPKWMKYKGKTTTDDIVEQSINKDINILDLRDIIINNKKDNVLLYFKTDTHWNNLGASIAYSETINYINNKFNLNLQKPNYTIKDQFRPSGDLSSFLKINTILDEKYENSYILNFENNQEVCHGNININTGVLEKCTNKLNPIMGINTQAQYMINENIKDNKKLLLLCDSFGTATSELYNLTFNTIWKWHYAHIDGVKLSSFVEENKPDVVIYQIVERALYNDSIVASPNISQISINNINLENQIFDIKQNNYFKNEQLELNFKNDNYNLNAINSDPIIVLNETKANSKNVILSYEINSNIETTFQLFYKKENNSNYNEADSYTVPLKMGNNKINLLIPSKYINNNLRVDLVSNIGKYEVKEFKIYSK